MYIRFNFCITYLVNIFIFAASWNQQQYLVSYSELDWQLR